MTNIAELSYYFDRFSNSNYYRAAAALGNNIYCQSPEAPLLHSNAAKISGEIRASTRLTIGNYYQPSRLPLRCRYYYHSPIKTANTLLYFATMLIPLLISPILLRKKPYEPRRWAQEIGRYTISPLPMPLYRIIASSRHAEAKANTSAAARKPRLFRPPYFSRQLTLPTSIIPIYVSLARLRDDGHLPHFITNFITPGRLIIAFY